MPVSDISTAKANKLIITPFGRAVQCSPQDICKAYGLAGVYFCSLLFSCGGGNAQAEKAWVHALARAIRSRLFRLIPGAGQGRRRGLGTQLALVHGVH